jgi:hypothetical protein
MRCLESGFDKRRLAVFLKKAGLRRIMRDFKLSRSVNEFCALLGCYVAENGSLFWTFQDNVGLLDP